MNRGRKPGSAFPSDPSSPESPGAEELARLTAFFRERSAAVEPLPTPPLPERFSTLVGKPLQRRPRALILDVYGTLLVSGAGEVGTAAPASDSSDGGLEGILREFGVAGGAAAFEGRLRREIERVHGDARAAGIPYPEVDGAAVLARLTGKPLAEARLLGAARESALNPASPMPGARELLSGARRAGLALGIVSNAQYYTLPALEAAFGTSFERLGFDPELCVWSWRLGRAKPDPELFRILARALETRGVALNQAVYVGNDLLNDVLPAKTEGFGTALFAGDARSLRLRPDDPRTEGLLPDTVLPSFLGASAVFRLGGRDPFLCLPRGPGDGK